MQHELRRMNARSRSQVSWSCEVQRLQQRQHKILIWVELRLSSVDSVPSSEKGEKADGLVKFNSEMERRCVHETKL